MKDYDVVKLTKNFLEYGLVKGQKGTILIVHDEYYCEVEFVDDKGTTLYWGTFPIDCLELVCEYKE